MMFELLNYATGWCTLAKGSSHRNQFAVAWQVARIMALAPQRNQRWRQFSLIVGSLVGVFAVLVGVSSISAGLHTDQQVRNRQLQPIQYGTHIPGLDTAVLKADMTMPVVPGGFSQIPVVWVQPLPGQENNPNVIPPGLSALPEPGAAVLSPGLAQAGFTAEDFGFKTSAVGLGEGGTIGDAGLASRSEGYIYTSPLNANQFPNSPTVIESTGFTGKYSLQNPLLETTLDVPSAKSALFGTLWLIFLPATFLLFGAARASSAVCEQRAWSLWRQGVATRAIRLTLFLEGAVLAGLGATAACCAWLAVAPRIVRVPFGNGESLPGAFHINGLLIIACAALCVFFCGAAASSFATRPKSCATSGQQARKALIVPLAACLIIMAVVPDLYRAVPGGISAEFFEILLLGSALGVSLALPFALPAIATIAIRPRFRRSTPSAWLSAKKLGFRSVEVTRPAALVGSLVFISCAATALFLGLQKNYTEPIFETSAASVWQVRWNNATPADVDMLRNRAESEGYRLQVPHRKNTDNEGAPELAAFGVPGAKTIKFQSCEQANSFFGQATQSVDCAYTSKKIDEAFPEFSLVISPTPSTERFTTDQIGRGEVFLSAPPTWTDVDVMKAFSGLPVVDPAQISGPQPFSGNPSLDWFGYGAALMSLLLFLALIRQLTDRSLHTGKQMVPMLRIGLSPQQVQRSHVLTTLLPVAVTIPVATLAAALFSLRGYSMGLTVHNLGLILMVAVLVTVLCLAAIFWAAWWSRKALQES